MRLIDYAEQFSGLLPEVSAPKRKLDAADRVLYTGVALFVFLLCSQIPLYGIRPKEAADPFQWMRVILASNKGTLMELGMYPMVTASMMMQLGQGTRLLAATDSPSDRRLVKSFEKLLALVIAVATAATYVYSGSYGDLRVLGKFKAVLIVAQLTLTSTIVTLLDEMLSRGWGFGSGISLFIATNVCESIFFQCFSPFTLNAGRGPEFEGCIAYLTQQLLQNPNKMRALQNAMYRTHLPNLMSLLATAVVFAGVTFAQGFGLTMSLRAPNGQPAPQKIPLFYTSNMPVILQSTLASNVMILSSMLAERFPKNQIVHFLGRWEADRASGRGSVPVSGVAYYMTPPHDLQHVVGDPFHACLYAAFVVAGCAMFANVWVKVSNQTGRDLAKRWHSYGLTLAKGRSGFDALQQQVDRHVGTATTLGGLCIGLLTITADLLGAIGSGTGILLAVTAINGLYDELKQEKMLPAVLGKSGRGGR